MNKPPKVTDALRIRSVNNIYDSIGELARTVLPYFVPDEARLKYAREMEKDAFKKFNADPQKYQDNIDQSVKDLPINARQQTETHLKKQARDSIIKTEEELRMAIKMIRNEYISLPVVNVVTVPSTLKSSITVPGRQNDGDRNVNDRVFLERLLRDMENVVKNLQALLDPSKKTDDSAYTAALADNIEIVKQKYDIVKLKYKHVTLPGQSKLPSGKKGFQQPVAPIETATLADIYRKEQMSNVRGESGVKKTRPASVSSAQLTDISYELLDQAIASPQAVCGGINVLKHIFNHIDKKLDEEPRPAAVSMTEVINDSAKWMRKLVQRIQDPVVIKKAYNYIPATGSLNDELAMLASKGYRIAKRDIKTVPEKYWKPSIAGDSTQLCYDYKIEMNPSMMAPIITMILPKNYPNVSEDGPVRFFHIEEGSTCSIPPLHVFNLLYQLDSDINERALDFKDSSWLRISDILYAWIYISGLYFEKRKNTPVKRKKSDISPNTDTKTSARPASSKRQKLLDNRVQKSRSSSQKIVSK